MYIHSIHTAVLKKYNYTLQSSLSLYVSPKATPWRVIISGNFFVVYPTFTSSLQATKRRSSSCFQATYTESLSTSKQSIPIKRTPYKYSDVLNNEMYALRILTLQFRSPQLWADDDALFKFAVSLVNTATLNNFHLALSIQKDSF